MKAVFNKWNSLGLVKRIIIGLLVGIVLALIAPKAASPVTILGSLFVGALRAIAPVLVFFLVIAATCKHTKGHQTNMKHLIVLYILGPFLAGVVAVAASFMFPVNLELVESVEGISPPENVTEVLKTLLMNIVDNPFKAIVNANYIGILAWALVFGIALTKASDATKQAITDWSDAVTQAVRWIINFAPFGIMGLVFDAITTSGIETLISYGYLLGVLVGTMLFVALILNPAILFVHTHRNPYPIVFTALKESGITAFFTRSSAANIPVNMALCEKLKFDKNTYSVAIPLGATINMGGAAVTISVLTIAAVHTLGINVDIGTAIILSLTATLCAAGASGVAGGSLLLIPLACSLFGIPDDIAMQVVGIGFIIGVVQDSCETALNSSSDIVFIAAAEGAKKRKEGIV